MQKRYGGVRNWRNLNEIEEAVVYEKPQIRYSSWDLLAIIFKKFIKLTLPVSAVMLLIGGLFVLVGTLSK